MAIAQVRTDRKNVGCLLSSDYLLSVGEQAQTLALQDWVRDNKLQKSSCFNRRGVPRRNFVEGIL
ncbi:MAG: hypothetical protein ACI9KN_002514 [Gammaproteobacteria bacterium]